MGAEPHILRQVRREGNCRPAAQDRGRGARGADSRVQAMGLSRRGQVLGCAAGRPSSGDPEDEDLEHLARVADAVRTVAQLLENRALRRGGRLRGAGAALEAQRPSR